MGPLLNLKQTNTTMSRGISTKTMSSKNWQRGRSFSSETRPSRRVLTLNPSQELTPQPSTCSPSMSAELTPEPTETERSCTKEELRLSGLRCLRLAGRRSLVNGQRDQKPSFQNGSEFVQAKRQETQKHQRVKKMPQLKKLKPKKNMMKRKRKRFLTLNLEADVRFLSM